MLDGPNNRREKAADPKGALEAAARLAAAPYHAYTRALESRPLLTKACTRWVPGGRPRTGLAGVLLQHR